MRLAGKTALIIGASHGIGKATALRFAEEGADVAITFRNREAGGRDTEVKIVALGRKVICFPADVTKTEDCARAIDETLAAFGHIDVLVNNAGGGRRGALLDISLEDWHYAFDLCVIAPFLLSQRAAKAMAESGRGGSIINISSVHSSHVWAHRGSYGVAKAALNRLTKSMALEWAHLGIRANAIAPGYINVAETEEEHARYDSTDGLAAPSIVAQRNGVPKEIADVALFLASDESSYVTGQTIFADGGLLLPVVTTADFIRGDRSPGAFTG